MMRLNRVDMVVNSSSLFRKDIFLERVGLLKAYSIFSMALIAVYTENMKMQRAPAILPVNPDNLSPDSGEH